MTSPAPARPWLVLAGLALGVTVTHGFARLAYGLLLPAMKSEMGWRRCGSGHGVHEVPGALRVDFG